jgi:hypothetical protein
MSYLDLERSRTVESRTGVTFRVEVEALSHIPRSTHPPGRLIARMMDRIAVSAGGSTVAEPQALDDTVRRPAASSVVNTQLERFATPLAARTATPR